MSCDEGWTRIRANFQFLVENVDTAGSGLADHLYSVGIVDHELFQEITNKQFTTEHQVRTLLRSLIKRRINPEPYAQFREALKINCGEFIVERLDKCDITQLSYVDDADEVDAGRPMNINVLVNQMTQQSQLLLELKDQVEKLRSEKQSNCDLADEGKKPQEDIQRALEDARRKGGVEESFIKVFVLPPSSRQPLEAGDGAFSGYVFPEFHQLASAWELLTACRLSVDLVHYLTAVTKGGSQPPKPFCGIATSLRQLVDAVLAKEANREVFENALVSLDVSELNGYRTFAAIFDELFNRTDETKKIHWGRITVWFAFCSYLARSFPASTESATLDVFGIYNWFFLEQKLSKSIASAGGWVSV
jgi:hypothetical protein